MFDEKQGPIENLVHLYVDGAFSRRELIQRVAAYTGSMAAAIAAVGSFSEVRADDTPACAIDASVPADAPDLNISDVQFAGEASSVFGHLAYPLGIESQVSPAVIVIHENRGLVEHIRDVTRRVGRAGFVSLGVDLLSRQGGTAQFTDAAAQSAAYGRTTVEGRRADLIAGIAYLKTLPFVQADRIGVVGFCADLAVNVEELAAAVAFYGTPLPTDADVAKIKAPVLANYAELDRALTLRTAPVMTAMITLQKTFGFRIYQGVGHAFHNDTGPNYNAAASCDAWTQTIAWFDKFLRAPAA
jgi:carboxymethylenebutenolidase